MSPHSANTVTAPTPLAPVASPTPTRALLRVAGLAVALLACGDTVTIVECPPGTRPEGSDCLPLDEPDTALPDAAVPDTDLSDTVLPETLTDTSNETVPSDTTSDLEVGPTTRPTGSPCSRNADCEGGTCLDWTGGYCTRLDCDIEGCPTGETCLPLLGNSICVKDCPAGTCDSPDQQCKPLPTASGLAPVCIAIDVGAGTTGHTCQDPTDCAGPAACLAAFPGGYCASLGCPDIACGAGSTCVRVDGVPSCLATCSTTADCDSEPGAERRCGVLSGINNTPVDVCISGVEGKALGATCRTDFECDSGTCQVLGEGRCSQTQAPCFTSSVATDCNGAEFCQVTAESRVGICSQPCNAGRSCSGSAHCVTEGKDPNQAWCRPSCSGSNDTSCNTVAGLTCAFGIPVSDSGQGRYACALSRAATPRATCNGDAQCPGGTCIKPSNANGYCATVCGADDFCPFGGSCVTTTSQRCMRACFSNADCPSSFACGFTTGSPRDVCVP